MVCMQAKAYIRVICDEVLIECIQCELMYSGIGTDGKKLTILFDRKVFDFHKCIADLLCIFHELLTLGCQLYGMLSTLAHEQLIADFLLQF